MTEQNYSKNNNDQQQNQSKKKKLHDAYYRVMVNLPVIIKDKDLLDRKHTIDVFKRKAATNYKQPPAQKKSLQNQKSPDDQIGRIYINELWSDKFHKLVMKESKIQEVLEKISKLYRRNVEDFVEDIHQTSVAKNIANEVLISQHINECSTPHLPRINQTISFNQANNNTNNNNQLNINNQDNIHQIIDVLEDQSSIITNSNLNLSKIKTLEQDNNNINKNSNSNNINRKHRKQLSSQSVNNIFQRNEQQQSHEMSNFERSLKQKYKKRQKDDYLSQPKYNVFDSLMNPSYYKNTQNIISQCKSINEEWQIKRQMQKDIIPFYINKDDRY